MKHIEYKQNKKKKTVQAARQQLLQTINKDKQINRSQRLENGLMGRVSLKWFKRLFPSSIKK